MRGGWSCQVDQGHYGHRAPKATWLYYVGASPPPSLVWGPSGATGRVVDMGRAERRQTPEVFAALLLAMADLSTGGGRLTAPPKTP